MILEQHPRNVPAIAKITLTFILIEIVEKITKYQVQNTSIQNMLRCRLKPINCTSLTLSINIFFNSKHKVNTCFPKLVARLTILFLLTELNQFKF